ncbi:MAG: hypothetical protein Ta2F_08440 [Termitinemataceae bacterium]|nr:MAG: hypothetical protein Ta2F_08440 [Termitinemataceae bacterium]
MDKELLDISPGSVRSLLTEIVNEQDFELTGKPTAVEEVNYDQIRGRVVEFVSDIRNGKQIILIVANKNNKAYFDSKYHNPPWLKSINKVPPDLVAFTLAKKIDNTTRNEIFSFSEDVEGTKNILMQVKEAAKPPPPPPPPPPKPPKPLKSSRKPVVGPFLKSILNTNKIWMFMDVYGGLINKEDYHLGLRYLFNINLKYFGNFSFGAAFEFYNHYDLFSITPNVPIIYGYDFGKDGFHTFLYGGINLGVDLLSIAFSEEVKFLGYYIFGAKAYITYFGLFAEYRIPMIPSDLYYGYNKLSLGVTLSIYD